MNPSCLFWSRICDSTGDAGNASIVWSQRSVSFCFSLASPCRKGKGNLIQRLQLWGTALAGRLSFRKVYTPTLLVEPKSSVHWKASKVWVLHSIRSISTRSRRETGMKTTERLFGLKGKTKGTGWIWLSSDLTVSFLNAIRGCIWIKWKQMIKIIIFLLTDFFNQRSQ